MWRRALFGPNDEAIFVKSAAGDSSLSTRWKKGHAILMRAGRGMLDAVRHAATSLKFLKLACDLGTFPLSSSSASLIHPVVTSIEAVTNCIH